MHTSQRPRRAREPAAAAAGAPCAHSMGAQQQQRSDAARPLRSRRLLGRTPAVVEIHGQSPSSNAVLARHPRASRARPQHKRRHRTLARAARGTARPVTTAVDAAIIAASVQGLGSGALVRRVPRGGLKRTASSAGPPGQG